MTTTPPTDQQLADTRLREELLAALSTAGAFCGDCGFEPGEIGCSDCVRVREQYADALTPITDRLRAELATAQRQSEAAHCRLHHVLARVEQIGPADEPAGIALDLIPWLDGPLHPDHLAAYRAALAAGES
ncbi:hypothetical protein [Kitasatospora mediocidica]|uniref:hypothetical protein n=1 Tax=Kitasatospora mediocidica TaxID=58352 RepID=UPI000568EA2D|nr:hypothetical protein [Kitasatospora mediocidica]